MPPLDQFTSSWADFQRYREIRSHGVSSMRYHRLLRAELKKLEKKGAEAMELGLRSGNQLLGALHAHNFVKQQIFIHQQIVALYDLAVPPATLEAMMDWKNKGGIIKKLKVKSSKKSWKINTQKK